MVSASPYKEKITLDFILFFVTSALNKKIIQLKSTQMYFRSKEITISCCKVNVNITVQSYRYLNERSGCLQYTCTQICNTGIFFSSHHPNSIYTFLKPDKVQSIFPLGRMEENCFIRGKIISCCQKVLSSHIKHKIFHDFYKAKQQN